MSYNRLSAVTPHEGAAVGDDITAVSELVKQRSAFVDPLFAEIGKVVVGQREMVEGIVAAMLCDGHILLEGAPGLAKTLTVSTVAQAVRLSFKRLQFTPDLMPADLTGAEIYNAKEATFTTRKGPLFANIILADEINRAPAKVQSALLEAMQERQVTIGGETFPLPIPFLVMATQNPIEQEGTYPLPEAQVDRFMVKILIGYPSPVEEREIIRRNAAAAPVPVASVVGPGELAEAKKAVEAVYMDDKLVDYIVRVVHATRAPEQYGLDIGPLIEYGASPRASIYLARLAKTLAFMDHRGYVIPDDIKKAGPDVLRHRVIPTYEADAENVTPEELIGRIFDAVEVP
jgi:MoxR-like ATPase